MNKAGTTILIVVAALAAFLALYFLLKKQGQAGSTGARSYLDAATGATQDVTEASMQTGGTLVAGVGAMARGTASAAKDVADTLTPFKPSSEWLPWNW
jgi:hypothetical protein